MGSVSRDAVLGSTGRARRRRPGPAFPHRSSQEQKDSTVLNVRKPTRQTNGERQRVFRMESLAPEHALCARRQPGERRLETRACTGSRRKRGQRPPVSGSGLVRPSAHGLLIVVPGLPCSCSADSQQCHLGRRVRRLRNRSVHQRPTSVQPNHDQPDRKRGGPGSRDELHRVRLAGRRR